MKVISRAQAINALINGETVFIHETGGGCSWAANCLNEL